MPVHVPLGGPNYLALVHHAICDTKIDRNGDAMEDMTFRFKFSTALSGGTGTMLPIGDKAVAIPLRNAGSIANPNDPNINLTESFRVSLITGTGASATSSRLRPAKTRPPSAEMLRLNAAVPATLQFKQTPSAAWPRILRASRTVDDGVDVALKGVPCAIRGPWVPNLEFAASSRISRRNGSTLAAPSPRMLRSAVCPSPTAARFWRVGCRPPLPT